MINEPINYVTFNNHALTDFGVYVSGKGTYGAPERDCEEIEVPGRNGSVYLDNKRFKNLDITYSAFIVDDEFSQKIDGLRAFLCYSSDYHKLEDTYHQSEYRMAIYKGPFDPDVHDSLLGASFDLTFTCKPQRFLKVGDTPHLLMAGESLYNPTLYTSKPIIRVVGTGELEINGVTLQVTKNSDYTDLDCELEDAYHVTENRNANVITPSIDYPSLSPGNNTINYSGFSSVQITPRWWTI